MRPAGFMRKHVMRRPDWLAAPSVVDLYSVSGCMSKDFADFAAAWKHNGYWLFNAPQTIDAVALALGVDLGETTLFYYEVDDVEFDAETGCWTPFEPDSTLTTNVEVPVAKRLQGFDVVTYSCRSAPECSPLTCNALAVSVPVNAHGLIPIYAQARTALESGGFTHSEPGPHRIFAVYAVGEKG